jgi:alpha-L-rhamnosidase
MLGHIVEWLYHDLAGIQMDPTAPGFSHVIIHPDFIEDLTEVNASYHSIHGEITSEWKRNGKQIILHIVISPNTIATVEIPSRNLNSISEGSTAIAEIKGVSSVRFNNFNGFIKVGSGDYTWVSVDSN